MLNPSQPLPPLAELKSHVQEQGYVVLPSLLTDQRCAFFKESLERDYARYSPFYASSQTSGHGLQDKSGEKVVYNLHNKSLDYFDLFDQPDVRAVLDSLLLDGSYMNAEDYLLLNTSARCPRPGALGQQLHLDSNLPGGDFPLIMVVLWMLDDFKPENGATRVLPGSHRFLSYPENGVSHPEEVVVSAPRGSALIYNAALWHGGGDNHSHDTRWAVVLGFGRWFIKPSFDFNRNTPPHIYQQLNDSRKQLLGFRANPPQDEFRRIRRRSEEFETPQNYQLPG